MKSKKMEEAIAKRVEEAIAQFEEWYGERGYNEAVAGAPWDGEECRFLGTIDAENLLPDFFEAHGKCVFYEEALRKHCYEIGELFNADKWNVGDDTEAGQTRQFLSDLFRIQRVRERFKKK